MSNGSNEELQSGDGVARVTRIGGATIQERYEKNPLSALKIEALPPSIINKLRTEPADYIGAYDFAKRENYIQ